MFADLVMIPKRQQNIMRRKKTFQTHLLSSKENQEIIWKADEISKKKEETQLQRQKQMKEIIQNERKNKKKVTCRKDTVKARKLPVKRLWGVQNCKYKFKINVDSTECKLK